LVVLGLTIFGQAHLARLDQLVVCIGLSLLIWLIPYLELGIPPVLALIYPLTILATEAAALQSLRFSFAGRLTWKSRSLGRPRWKWF